MKEAFKNIPGYEGLYQVSNLGNIKSFNYRKPNKTGLGKFGKLHHNSKTVLQYTKGGKYLNTFYGASEAERETGISNRNIASCCLGKLKTAGNFVWQYATT